MQKFKELREKLLNENSPIYQELASTHPILPKTVLTPDILKQMLIRDAKGVSSFLGNAILFYSEDDLIKGKEILANVGFTQQETGHYFNDKVGLHVFEKRQPDGATSELYVSIDGINPYKFINMLNTLQYGWLGVEKPIATAQQVPDAGSDAGSDADAGDGMSESVDAECKCNCETDECTCGCKCEGCRTALTEEEQAELKELQEDEKKTTDDFEPLPTDDKYLKPEECWWVYYDESKEITEFEGKTLLVENNIPKSGCEVISETVTKEYVYRNGKLTMKFRTNKPGYKIVRDGHMVREVPMSSDEQRRRKLAAMKSKFARRSKKTSLFRKRRASIKKHKSYLGYKPYKARKK